MLRHHAGTEQQASVPHATGQRLGSAAKLVQRPNFVAGMESDRWLVVSTHDLTQGVVGRCVLSSKRGSALMPLQLEVVRTPSALHA